ncbi:IS630 family transposase [Thalassotalea euphylliae]|uniref:IS630 family transposase n=1 Tax=Thalassotalea euphylliae TaxID=1655234 RepID=UPI003F8EB9E5
MHHPTELKKLAQQESNARVRMRLLAIYHFSLGQNRAQIAQLLGVARGSVNKWVNSYLSAGLKGLQSKVNKGRPSKLSQAQLNQLSAFVLSHAEKNSGGRLIGEDIQQFIAQEFDVTYSLRNIYHLLHALGFSWITSRSKHPKQSEQAQAVFKNFRLETILNTPWHVQPEDVDVWFQDEARFGQQNQVTRTWAKKGSRPRAVKQQQFDYGYLFGAVCPSTGQTEALITPLVNKAMMTEHLSQISKATPQGRHAVVIIDGAGWHTMDTASPFSNLTLIKLPPYSPELNPIEQVWQWLRQHCLSNRVFSGFDEIVEQVSVAWNTFISDIDRVKKLCTRDWIKVVR